MRALSAADLSPSSTILIIGGGPIGLAILLCMHAQGITTTMLSEVTSGRRAAAARFGAMHVFDPVTCDVVSEVRRLTGPANGVDVVFDCAGVQAGLEVGLRAVRARGTVVNVAVWERRPVFDVNVLLFKESRFVGTAAPEHGDFEKVLKAMEEGRLKPEGLVTGTVGLEEVEEGYRRLIVGKEKDIKVLVEIWGGD
jgi:threonine dehydrogenase-like Zn-dependent dehydrogenase